MAAAANLPAAAAVLLRLVDAPPAERPALAGGMSELEHAGDDATHAIMAALNSSFITPFDREDIALMTARLDDVLDYMEPPPTSPSSTGSTSSRRGCAGRYRCCSGRPT